MSLRFQRVQVVQKPAEAKTYTFVCKRKWSNFLDDSATPILQGIDLALEAFVHGDMLRRMRQYGKSKELYSEAAALLTIAENEETWQQAQRTLVVPDSSGDVDYSEPSDWMN